MLKMLSIKKKNDDLKKYIHDANEEHILEEFPDDVEDAVDLCAGYGSDNAIPLFTRYPNIFIEGGDDPDICEINEMELNQINNIKTLCDYLECYNNVTDRGLIEENIKRGTLCASFNVLKNTTRPLIVLLRVVIMIIVANVYERIVLNDLECVSKEERKEPECGYGGASGTMGERDKVRQEAEHTEQQTGHGVSGVLIPRGSHPNVNLLNISSLHNSYINFEKKDKIEESEHLCNAMQEQTKYRKDQNFKIFVKSYLEIEWY
ncbi:unnamed protein product [Plasmodium vivax]|uniref:(malaria parasite P. vivax) hypothetical protein n=1 Tax=Plasmodium vivax TaxID=5855 RepID=A0A8S4HKD1_PLAVI|nr:unnamed protein product [Plasmodium vivax]